MGREGMVPSAAEEVCPVCHGTGTYSDDLPPAGTDTCSRCHGRGKIIDMTAGLGHQGMEPAYREVTCPDCGGSGTTGSWQQESPGGFDLADDDAVCNFVCVILGLLFLSSGHC